MPLSPFLHARTGRRVYKSVVRQLRQAVFPYDVRVSPNRTIFSAFLCFSISFFLSLLIIPCLNRKLNFCLPTLVMIS